MTKALTGAQFKRLADTVNALGLAALIGGAGDTVVNGTRPTMDRLGICAGLLLLTLSVYLSRWEDTASNGSIKLTRSRDRR